MELSLRFSWRLAKLKEAVLEQIDGFFESSKFAHRWHKKNWHTSLTEFVFNSTNYGTNSSFICGTEGVKVIPLCTGIHGNSPYNSLNLVGKMMFYLYLEMQNVPYYCRSKTMEVKRGPVPESLHLFEIRKNGEEPSARSNQMKYLQSHGGKRMHDSLGWYPWTPLKGQILLSQSP